jgi:hypothetical protein
VNHNPRIVPAEHLGQARLFRDSVRREDLLIEAAMDTMAAPLNERLRRKPLLRPETPMGVLRIWAQTVPTGFRIGPSRVQPARAEFAIVETRITVSWLNDRAWENDEHERGLAVCNVVFAVHGGRLIRQWQPVVNVSFHGLGRWFERTGKRQHELLLADLTTLAEAPDDAGEKVYCPPRGIWLGDVIDAFDDTARRGVKLRNVALGSRPENTPATARRQKAQ